MARMHVRYLTSQPGPAGALPRYFWQPTAAMRAEGWRAQRVPLEWDRYTDAAALLAAAIARAEELNAELDAERERRAVDAVRPPPPATRTLADLIKAFQCSRDWQGLAPATQRSYRQCLARIETWAGNAPVRAIDAVRVQRLKHSLSATPAFANAIIRVLRLLLEHGRRNGWVALNAATRPALTGSTPSGLIWPHAAVLAFVAAADEEGRYGLGTAVLLNEWLGQREGDILRMPRNVLRPGPQGSTLMVRQSKTLAGVRLPIGMVPHLAARLDAELLRTEAYDPRPTTIITSEETQRPYLSDNFRHVFNRVRAKAAKLTPVFEIDYLLPGRDMADPEAFCVRMGYLTFMQLRHTAVTRLAEAGCDTPLIASITGHSQETVTALMRRYMVRTGELARVAFQKRLDAERES
jgi:integrase